jgi:hypothetical protein
LRVGTGVGAGVGLGLGDGLGVGGGVAVGDEVGDRVSVTLGVGVKVWTGVDAIAAPGAGVAAASRGALIALEIALSANMPAIPATAYFATDRPRRVRTPVGCTD